MTGEGRRELQPTDSFQWVRIIDVIEFETAQVVQKIAPKHRPAARTIAGIAYRLAFWADPDGGNVRPGLPLITVTCRVDIKTAKIVMGVLRDMGLVDSVARGGGSKATTYRLTTPSDLLEQARVLSPDEVKARMKKVTPAHRPRNTGGMHPPMQDEEEAPELAAQGGCTPQCDDEREGNTGGMPPILEEHRGDDSTHGGRMHPQYRPETYQPNPPTKTSPSVSSSPAGATDVATTDPARPDVAARAAALRAGYRTSRAANPPRPARLTTPAGEGR